MGFSSRFRTNKPVFLLRCKRRRRCTDFHNLNLETFKNLIKENDGKFFSILVFLKNWYHRVSF